MSRQDSCRSTSKWRNLDKMCKGSFWVNFLVPFAVCEGDTDDIDYILEVLVREVEVEIY